MDGQTRFRTALAALSAKAARQDGFLGRADMQEFFDDMELTEGQYSLVHEYLMSKNIRIEGVKPTQAEEKEISLTDAEQELLRRYRRDLKNLRRQQESELTALYEQAADGGEEARQLLIEHHMPMVPKLAVEYAGRGLSLSDLLQEGSVGLMIGVDTLCLREEELSEEEHLERSVRREILRALDEQDGARGTGEQIVEKLNKLADAITELTEDLGRQATPEEVAFYLNMPIEELEDLLRVAGETIELADGTK